MTPTLHPTSALWTQFGRIPIWAVLLLGVVLVGLGGLVGVAALAAVAGVGLLAATVMHPPIAAYAMVGLAPFVIGFERGEHIPLLRPNEALLIALWAAIICRRVIDRRRFRPSFTTIDVALGLLVVCASFVPLLIAVGRLKPVSGSDFLYAITLWKLLALYGLFRVAIRTDRQVGYCLWILMATASVLGILAALDGRNVFGFAERLAVYFPVEEGPSDDGRGAATIGNAIGMGGYIVVATSVGLAMFVRKERPRWLVASCIAACVVGAIGTGQFTTFIGLAIGGLALGYVTKSTLALARLAVPMMLVFGIVLAPVVQERLEGFETDLTSTQLREIQSLPAMEQPAALKELNPGSSWQVRQDNLERYFLPAFDDPVNLIVGVTPQARMPAVERYREWVWIESGYVWLLWTGGLPLVLAFIGFIVTGCSATRAIARVRRDATGQAAAAAFASLVVLALVQALDPHLTLRGTSDLFFPVLALAQIGSAGRALLPDNSNAKAAVAARGYACQPV